MKKLSKRQRQVRSLFKELLGADLVRFPKAGEPLQAPDRQGVYIIYDPHGRVAHVGASIRGAKGLWQRLRNHLNGQSSFTRKSFDRDGSKLRRGYSYRCLTITDPHCRAYLENYASGYLCPSYIGLGQLKQSE